MSSSKRPLPAKKAAAGCPGWMMTFGDCMSLLVTFFVMLIAFSTLEEAKLAALVGVLRGAFGAVDLRHSLGAVERKALTDVEAAAPVEAEHTLRGESESLQFLTADEMAEALPDFINEIRPHEVELVSDRILIQMLDDGLSIMLETTCLFEEGTAVWRQDFSKLWEGIAALLLGRDNEIRITSVSNANAPVHRDVAATSWGLGIVRADHIARQLQEAMHSPASRFGLGVQVFDGENGTARTDHVEIMIMEQARIKDVGKETVWPKGLLR